MKKLFRALLPVAILALGIAVMIGLVMSKPKARKAERAELGTLVEASPVEPERRTIEVRAHGTVVPARQVVLSPEVSGRVTWMSSELVPGGRFTAGDTMVRIDARDYSLAVEQQYAQVDQAATALEIEKGRKKIAEREWELLGDSKDKQGAALALRDPQLRTAEVALRSAESALERARMNVGRTKVSAPFNGLVQTRAVDIGQLVGPSSPLVTLVGTDAFWVQLSIPVDRLAWIDIPEVRGATEGSPARVWRQIGDQRIEREGRVIRLMGDLDPLGRMAKVLVEIDDPLGLSTPARTAVGEGAQPPAPGLPLLLGAFVEVAIDGREVDHVVEIPREALRHGDNVYLVDSEKVSWPESLSGLLFWADSGDRKSLLTLDRMETRPVQVLWRMPDTVLVNRGLEAGDVVITSPVPAPIDGMKVRIAPPSPTRSGGDEQASVVP